MRRSRPDPNAPARTVKVFLLRRRSRQIGATIHAVRAIGVIALGLTLATAATAASSRPALQVMDLRPFTVHGARFHSGENLRIVITTKHRFVRKLEASGKGTFTLALHLSIGRCAQYSVRAYGPSGLRAAVKSSPESCGADIGPAKR